LVVLPVKENLELNCSSRGELAFLVVSLVVLPRKLFSLMGFGKTMSQQRCVKVVHKCRKLPK